LTKETTAPRARSTATGNRASGRNQKRSNATLSNCVFMDFLEAAGLPNGVINFLPGDPIEISNTVLARPELAGIHLTGSTAVFDSLWTEVGRNISRYRGYPRLIGETGGKDFVLTHPSAEIEALAVALVRGAFEYQGQKCSAASRAYIVGSEQFVLSADRAHAIVIAGPQRFHRTTRTRA